MSASKALVNDDDTDLLTIEEVLEEDYVVRSVLKQLAAMHEMLEEHEVLGYSENTEYATTLKEDIKRTLDNLFVGLHTYVDDMNAAICTE